MQSKTDNIKGGVDRITNLYDFTGQVLTSRSDHGTGKLTWQNMAAVRLDNDNLVSTATTSGWGYSGASSVERIAANQDGWVEVTVGDLLNRHFFGLSNQDVNTNFTSIKYAFYLNLSTLTIYANGLAVYTVPAALNTGDRLRIARQGGYISFYHNGIKVYPTGTAAQFPSTESLLVDVSIGTISGNIRNARTSAGQVAFQSTTRRFEYDHAGRLLTTWHKVGSNAEVLLARNEYNELGQLIDKKLHSPQAANVGDYERSYKQKYRLPL